MHHYTQTFKVIQCINEVTFTFHLPRQYQLSLTFHVSLFKPLVTGPLQEGPSSNVPPPPTLTLEREPVYTPRDSGICRGG